MQCARIKLLVDSTITQLILQLFPVKSQPMLGYRFSVNLVLVPIGSTEYGG
ncbi:hypothetical protein CEPID_02330 [Corynebacterium epidermidicanis]|uniref:Uncharacterized protein n=1 Tax=Corynebacterium epidermidicanis TaxID=1050174 RepID=A0A0G3GU10_9CORY|nr:hypothetical protein CEPID_02330 [Corynebacterium epidermidicanis]